MDYLYLSYYSNDMPKEELDLFFEYQEAIKEDCKRIKYMISDYENTEQKKRLIQFLDLIGSNIVKSGVESLQEELLSQELSICLNYNYVIFSFYVYDEKSLRNDGAYIRNAQILLQQRARAQRKTRRKQLPRV